MEQRDLKRIRLLTQLKDVAAKLRKDQDVMGAMAVEFAIRTLNVLPRDHEWPDIMDSDAVGGLPRGFFGAPVVPETRGVKLSAVNPVRLTGEPGVWHLD